MVVSWKIAVDQGFELGESTDLFVVPVRPRIPAALAKCRRSPRRSWLDDMVRRARGENPTQHADTFENLVREELLPLRGLHVSPTLYERYSRILHRRNMYIARHYSSYMTFL